VDQMMSIGVFSRRTGLTPKALRLYEQRGLMRPARVDGDTGYRYYAVRQLRQAEIIRLLRAFKLPIGRILEVLASTSSEELDRVLALEKQRIKREVRQLRAGHALLERMGALHAMAQQEPAVEQVELPATVGLTAAFAAPREHFDRRYMPAVSRLRARAKNLGLRECAREIALLPVDDVERLTMVLEPHAMLRVEIFLPVHPPQVTDFSLGLTVLPACLAARSAFGGDYWEGYRLAYASQLEWLLASPFTLRGPVRERYLCGAREVADTALHETELVWPLEMRRETGDPKSEVRSC